MKFKKVAVGGTFDSLHEGHKTLIEKAFEIGEFVVIGITSNAMKKGASPYKKRKEAVEDFLRWKKNFRIVKLTDTHGPAAAERDFDAIVVSDETKESAVEINRLREKRGMAHLKIVSIPLVLDKKGIPQSSSRIKRGEI
jgi:cytidyltransferase-like protein